MKNTVFKKGYIPWNKGRTGSIPWSKGKTKEDDIRLKQVSERTRIRWRDTNVYAENNEKVSHTMKGKVQRGELVQWDQGKSKENDERLRSQAKKLKELWQTPEYRDKMKTHSDLCSQNMKGHPNWATIEGNKKIHDAMLQKWSDPDSIFNNPLFLRRRAEAVRRGMENPERSANLQQSHHRRPNKFEKQFIELFPELKYVGDYAFFVGRKNPDFIIPNSQLCIDLFGDYWHETDEVEGRIKYFAERGYTLFIIWQADWKKNRISIQDFIHSLIVNQNTSTHLGSNPCIQVTEQ